MTFPLDDLDAAATLAAVEESLVVRRTAEARDLVLAAHWADLHAADPQLGPGVYVWQTPHGLTRLVDHLGTTVLPPGFCDLLLAA